MNKEEAINSVLQKYEVLNNQYLIIPNWKWLALAIIFSLAFVIHYIVHFVWLRLFKLAAKTSGELDDEI